MKDCMHLIFHYYDDESSQKCAAREIIILIYNASWEGPDSENGRKNPFSPLHFCSKLSFPFQKKPLSWSRFRYRLLPINPGKGRLRYKHFHRKWRETFLKSQFWPEWRNPNHKKFQGLKRKGEENSFSPNHDFFLWTKRLFELEYTWGTDLAFFALHYSLTNTDV